MATGDQRELDGINPFDPKCPIEYVITVEALKDGRTMKRTRFTDEQIIGILGEHEPGAKCADLCRKHGMSESPAA